MALNTLYNIRNKWENYERQILHTNARINRLVSWL